MAGEVTHVAEDKGWLYHPQFPDNWKRQPLASLAQWVNGLAFRDIQFAPTGMPVIKIAEIKGGISGQTKYTQQTFDESVRIRPGDLLFSWSGQPETSIDAFWWQGPEGWLNQHVFRVTPANGIDPVFLYYLLRYLKPNFIGIARNKQTTGLGHITKRDLENIEAAYPERGEQHAIAHILGTLDNKIAVNRRMSETLEAMARALFKSWFVDFDPVRAKATGRDPGIGKSLSDLFPDSFVSSEIGEIPTGWDCLSLRDIAEVLSGGTPNKSVAAYWGGSIPWISPKSMDSIHVETSDQCVTTAAIGNGTRIVPRGSVLVMVRGMGLHQGVRVSQAQSDVAFNQDVKALVPRSGSGPYLLFALLDACKYLFSKVSAAGHGTGVLATAILEELRFVVPPEKVRDKLLQPLAVLNAKIAANRQESKTLGHLRDTLLPQLISGQLRLSQIHKHPAENGR